MVPTESLFEIVESEGIYLEYLQLPTGFFGLYMATSTMQHPHIGLDRSLLQNERLHRCVLAHELGHYFRSAGRAVVAASTTALYYVCKTERLASEWAVDKLVPAVEFLQLVQRKYTAWEIADYFQVVPEFVAYRARRIYENGLVVREIKRYWKNIQVAMAQ